MQIFDLFETLMVTFSSVDEQFGVDILMVLYNGTYLAFFN